MDRRLFVTGLFGVAGTAALAAILPLGSEAAGIAGSDLAPAKSVLPNLEELKADQTEGDVDADDADDEEQLAWHNGYPHGRRRRRRRRRGWRRVCRRYRHGGLWRRRCRRRPHWISISIG